jgi:hypothetical protein
LAIGRLGKVVFKRFFGAHGGTVGTGPHGTRPFGGLFGGFGAFFNCFHRKCRILSRLFGFQTAFSDSQTGDFRLENNVFQLPNDDFQLENDKFQSPNDDFQLPNDVFQLENDDFQLPNGVFQSSDDVFLSSNAVFQSPNGVWQLSVGVG